MNMNNLPQVTPNTPTVNGAAMAIPLGITADVAERKKILIVDDSLVIRKTMSMKLKNSGYEVLEAADGGTALGIVRTNKPDLIVLDIFFPPDVAAGGGAAWDGFHIIEWLRRMNHAQSVPVMMMTGTNPEEYRERALKAGAIAFFSKPVNMEELLSTIQQTLQNAGLRS
jgi:CheY-like chemotaxis protein